MNKHILVLLFAILLSSCKNSFTENDFIGTYINNYDKNINLTLISPEAPTKNDTLTLFEGNTFVSQWFGQGEYKISKIGDYRIIDLSYKEDNLHVGYGLIIKEKSVFNQNPILNISIDGSYYYEKINKK